MGRNNILIFKPDDSPPREGVYEIRLKKNCPLRALGISCDKGFWSVYIDGELVFNSSADWKAAFGDLYRMPFLQGKPLDLEDYATLVSLRIADRLNNVDLNKSIHPNNQEISI